MQANKPTCPCCMRRHDVRVMRRREANLWKGVWVRYEAEYYWCTEADVYFADERMITKNHIAMLRAAIAAKAAGAQAHGEEQMKEMMQKEMKSKMMKKKKKKVMVIHKIKLLIQIKEIVRRKRIKKINSENKNKNI